MGGEVAFKPVLVVCGEMLETNVCFDVPNNELFKEFLEGRGEADDAIRSNISVIIFVGFGDDYTCG